MSPHRNVAPFDDRAPQYDHGWRGRLHHEIADRAAALAAATIASPGRVLDVGCGTGYLLRRLVDRYPNAERLCGIDAAPRMIATASRFVDDDRLSFTVGVAEKLDYPDGTFDLVISTTSFDHWTNQQAGLVECARVLRPDGHLVLVDRFSSWLRPTRRGRARTKGHVTKLVLGAGFVSPRWHPVYALIINGLTATKPASPA
jgi:ubiquinone/menaquinone biosynthesis C-methylase UbiE